VNHGRHSACEGYRRRSAPRLRQVSSPRRSRQGGSRGRAYRSLCRRRLTRRSDRARPPLAGGPVGGCDAHDAAQPAT
jgi:hypothetical protein